MLRSPELLRIVRVLTSRVEVTISIGVVALLMLIAATAGFAAPHDPYKQSLMDSLQPMSAAHPFGTDALGRDVLSRLMYGARVSLQVGVISVGIASTVGIALGLVAGYYRGIVDAVIMRTVDALMSIPPIILALAMAAALGGGLFNVMMALGIALIPAYARLMRGLVLVVRELDYVTSARVDGASAIRIMLHPRATELLSAASRAGHAQHGPKPFWPRRRSAFSESGFRRQEPHGVRWSTTDIDTSQLTRLFRSFPVSASC